MEKKILNINEIPRTIIAEPRSFAGGRAPQQLGLTGTKVGCGHGPVRLLLGHHGRQSRPLLRHQDEEGARTEPRSPPSRVSARRTTSTRSRWPGWSTAARSAASAARASSFPPRRFWTRTPTPPAKTSATGCRSTQRLPLHRLQAAGRRGHGCGAGAARRDEQRGHSPSSSRPTARSGAANTRVRAPSPK